jgi:chlorobactene glucosyltransferase
VLDGSDASLSLRIALVLAGVVTALFLKSRLNYLSIPRLLAIPKLRRLAETRSADCMVVIPARNEEQSIARAIRSFPHDSVIVVDDHSEDRTAQVAREAGAGVVYAPALPRGAVGKSNACLAGARVLTSKWIFFADADTSFDVGFLDAAVAHAETGDLAFLSIYPRAEGETFPERLLAPLATALYFCGLARRSDGAAIFNGQGILVRRDAYEFVGGHAAVLHNVIEDVKLAALGSRHRLKFGVARADDCARIQFREPWQTVARGAFRFTLVDPGTGVTIMIATVSIALWLPVLVWLLAGRHWPAAAAFALLPAMVTASWYRNAWALLAPLAVYWMLPIMCNGFVAAVTGRPVKWKGRVI